jgi:hypothetical protein
MRDDTAYVQDFLDRALPVPLGEYYCPDGLVLPAEYIKSAKAAGREPDASGDAFLLSSGPLGVGAKITFRSGAYVILSGYVLPPRDGGEATGDILMGKNDCAITIPHPDAARIEGGMGYGVPVNGAMGTGDGLPRAVATRRPCDPLRPRIA